MKYKLSDICEYVTEKVSVSALGVNTYISTENMLPNKAGKTLASSLPLTNQTQAFRAGDVLVSNIRPYFKKIWYASYGGGCSNDVLVFRAKRKVNPRFLYYVLADDAFFKYSMATSKGTKMPRGDKNAIMEYNVPNFDYESQGKIAGILGVIDEKLVVNLIINDNLTQQIQLFYDHLVEELNGESVELSSIVDIRDGTHDSPKPKETGFPLVTSKHLLPFGVDLSSTNLISQEDYNKINERSKVETYDILLSMIGTVGLVSLVIERPVSYAIKNVGLFKTSNCPDLYAFILPYLRSSKTTQHIERTLAGSTQKYISLGELRKMPIALPSEDELRDYNNVAIPLVNQIVNLTEENKRLVSLRDTLLPKLMSGKLDVADLDL